MVVAQGWHRVDELAGDPENVITLADFDGAKEHGVHFSNGYADGNAFHALAQSAS